MLVFHHLELSRSSRVLWLLEALGTPYELVIHKRNEYRRAMADLAEVHPLGKAPTIVDGDLVLTESSAILRYISERYGNGRFMPPPGTNAHAKHDEWLDYAEGSLMPTITMKLGSLMSGATGAADFAGPEFVKAINYVGSGATPGPFLMGNEVTLADMQMSYSLAMANSAGLLEGYPAVLAYWENIQADPGYKRAVELGGPLVLPFEEFMAPFRRG